MSDDFSSQQPIGGGIADIPSSSPHGQSNTIDGSSMEEVNRININELPFEVLLIFQYTIDIETTHLQRSFPSYPPKYVLMEGPVNRLASICRYWKEIVCDMAASMSESPRLVLWLDMRKSQDQLLRKVRGLKDFMHSDSIVGSKSSPNPTPLDVFITHITATNWTGSFSWGALCTNGLIPFIPVIPFNYFFHTLSLHFSDWNEDRRFISSASTLLTSLRALHLEWRVYKHDHEGGGEIMAMYLKLDEFLHEVPRLEELKMVGWSSLSIREREGTKDRSGAEKLYLPRLRCLEISVSKRVETRYFITLMRHTPNIEYLRLCGRIAMGHRTYRPPSDQGIVLPYLRKIHVHNRRFLPYPFVKGWIQTPGLSEMVVERTNRPRRGTILRWRKFLAFNPTITKLSFPAKPGYTVFLSEASGIQELTIDATMSTGDGWLRRLGDRDTKSLVSDERQLICPNLRSLSLLLGSETPSLSTFEPFICARCVPVGVEGNTAIGYKALEEVTLRFPAGSDSVMESIATKIRKSAWGDVEMERGEHDSGSEFRLQWRHSKPECSS